MSDTRGADDRLTPTRRAASTRHAAVGQGGLFGPDSVTWRLHADPLMGIAGLRALLLQALHPVAMAAAVDHPRRGEEVWERLARTAEYVGVTTYGTTTQALLAGSRVRAVHATISGVTAQGVPYSAEDPQLLAWVHCCLVASFLEVVTRAGLYLTGPEQDAYVGEQVSTAMLVGLEPGEVPHDRAQLVDYFRAIRPALECTPAARGAAAAIIDPPRQTPGRSAARPAWAPVAGLAFAALPPWARRLYAFEELPSAAGLTDSATTVGLATLRSALHRRG